MAFATTIEAASEPARAADDDDALMARYRGGDIGAFERLYRRHRAPLHRFLLRLSGGPAEAEEVFQEVWLAVLRGAERYAPEGRFVGYLYAIAHRRAADHARRRGRRLDAETAALDVIPLRAEAAADQMVGAEDLGRALLAALERLPLAQREAFLMQAEGGLTLEEIARATGAGRETVKSRLRYAHRRLRQIVEAHQ